MRKSVSLETCRKALNPDRFDQVLAHILCARRVKRNIHFGKRISWAKYSHTSQAKCSNPLNPFAAAPQAFCRHALIIGCLSNFRAQPYRDCQTTKNTMGDGRPLDSKWRGADVAARRGGQRSARPTPFWAHQKRQKEPRQKGRKP